MRQYFHRVMIPFLLLCLALPGFAQESDFQKSTKEKHLRYLASDELMGRRTGSEGITKAADYIIRELKSYGVQPAPGTNNFRQGVSLYETIPAKRADLSIGKDNFTQGENLMMMAGEALEWNTKAVFAGHGWIDAANGHDDYQGLDVRGKVVVTLPGTPESTDPMVIFESMNKKRKIAAEKGAVALFELHRISFPWNFFKNYFSRPSMRLDLNEPDESPLTIPYGWLKETELTYFNDLRESGKEVTSAGSFSGSGRRSFSCYNIVGIIDGKDPVLKNEYVLLSAHYDHVGVGVQGGGAYTQEDSIFNGARDNAMGTVALLAAAKALATNPPSRSVIILALTGEEVGLLGSQYYAERPLIPLDQTVFNLNTDGAGYNDTSYVSVIGFGRTGTHVDDALEAAASLIGLKVFPNPAPRQNLYDRSDNVSFARKGVPAVNFSPGITEFDQTINYFYHQVTDEADSVDMDYLLKYCKAFTGAARLIANLSERPFWLPGDKYEEAGKELFFGME